MNQTVQIKTALVEDLKELRLRAMLYCFEDMVRRAKKETLSYEQYCTGTGGTRMRQRRGNG